MGQGSAHAHHDACPHWIIARHLTLHTYACVPHPHPPSLPCADLKPLYSSSSKAALLGQLFERLAASLEESGALPPLAGGGSSEQQPAPQALVW